MSIDGTDRRTDTRPHTLRAASIEVESSRVRTREVACCVVGGSSCGVQTAETDSEDTEAGHGHCCCTDAPAAAAGQRAPADDNNYLPR